MGTSPKLLVKSLPISNLKKYCPRAWSLPIYCGQTDRRTEGRDLTLRLPWEVKWKPKTAPSWLVSLRVKSSNAVIFVSTAHLKLPILNSHRSDHFWTRCHSLTLWTKIRSHKLRIFYKRSKYFLSMSNRVIRFQILVLSNIYIYTVLIIIRTYTYIGSMLHWSVCV